MAEGTRLPGVAEKVSGVVTAVATVVCGISAGVQAEARRRSSARPGGTDQRHRETRQTQGAVTHVCLQGIR
jgi:hypothetical protein